MGQIKISDNRLTITVKDSSDEYDEPQLWTQAIVSLIGGAPSGFWMKDAIEAGEDDPTSSFYESILTEIAVHYAGDAIDYEQLDRKPVYEALLQLIQELRDEGRLQDLTGSLTQDDENE